MTTHSNPTHEAQATLDALIDAQLDLPPEYADALSSHLPMALHALYSLGANPPRMQDFYAHYAQRFQGQAKPLPAQAPADWQARRGDFTAYPALRTGFRQRIVRNGVDATLRAVLPDLFSGVAAAAFHGVIRTAHAVAAGHPHELANALAYWASRWQPLRPPAGHSGGTAMEFNAWAQTLAEQASAWRSNGDLISVRMDQACGSTIYQNLAAALQPAADTPAQLAALAELAIRTYAGSRNFTALHMVTGLRAIRVLLPWVNNPDALQPVLVHAFVAAYLAAGIQPLPAQRPATSTLGWADVITLAVASNDDHVVKLVHACREEAAHYGPGCYLQAATLAVGGVALPT